MLRREIAAGPGRRRRRAGWPSWSEDYDYDAIETCAVDGMCQTACPVLINTGDLVTPAARRSRAAQAAALVWARPRQHWGGRPRVAAAPR